MPRKRLADALQEAAEALRTVAEGFADDKDREEQSATRSTDTDRRGCVGSRRLLRNLGEALLETVNALREVVGARSSELECDDSRARDACWQDGSQPPMPPYPPYPPFPPYAPHAPFPPYPPYPPVIVIGGGGCGCANAQFAPNGVQAAAPTVQQPPIVSASAPAAVVAQPIGASRPTATSIGPAGFPDVASLQDVESLLDIGESAAALVRRTLSQRPERG